MNGHKRDIAGEGQRLYQDNRDTPHILRFETSPAYLPEGGSLVRLPRAPRRKRPPEFFAAFEDRALYYDAFLYGDGDTALLVGPPPHNLRVNLEKAVYRALPSGTVLQARLFPSRSTMITALDRVPEGTDQIEVTLGETTVRMGLGGLAAPMFSGARILFTINKNNRLDWIRTWAQWHVDRHGTDAVILFDNGSTQYGTEEIEQTLATVRGLNKIAVISLPHKFGPIDHWVMAYHFWPRFLQISACTIALRRFGMNASGLINCDIDELVWAGGGSVYDLTAQSELGSLRMPGRWIEAAYAGDEPVDHYGFQYRLKDLRSRLSPPKCTLDPSRDWVQKLNVHPYLHRIHGAPAGGRRLARNAYFWHFKGINTNWKEQRTDDTAVDPARHVPDVEWLAAIKSG
ncbi:MAG TPA: hypothetical protein VNS12_15065 [Pelagibacterium sp.]|uniref:hypothetical protein n=1 Tax=Pelagibacterium sp. TaxID=1967288 RepID=UPI002C7E0D51|nr:hypothetical protein [Pelagibacterium sp.]HWJ89385.1 hypothetical protein [Pelagibacterium sp.]